MRVVGFFKVSGLSGLLFQIFRVSKLPDLE